LNNHRDSGVVDFALHFQGALQHGFQIFSHSEYVPQIVDFASRLHKKGRTRLICLKDFPHYRQKTLAPVFDKDYGMAWFTRGLLPVSTGFYR